MSCCRADAQILQLVRRGEKLIVSGMMAKINWRHALEVALDMVRISETIQNLGLNEWVGLK